MKTMYLNPNYLEMFMHQNKGEIIDCVEGCLIDNLLIDFPKGTIGIFEHYLNCWSSDYLVKIASNKNDSRTLYTEFEELKEKYVESVGE